MQPDQIECDPKAVPTPLSPTDGPSDAELLDRFIRRQDDSAFALLVERHGAMVRGVCQRMLRDPHAVEDAFQATFLILVQKAASLGKPELLANWLYGVAYRTALHARAQAARRSHHEREAASMSPESVPSDDARRELLAALDEALESLPEKFRVPLILCYLEGKTNEQAAHQLGWPTGSISARLARGREMLRDRLLSRYSELLSAFLVGVLAESARSSTVPALLAGRTVQAARGMLQGETLGVKLMSPSVGSLMADTLAGMRVAKLKKAIGLVLVFVLTAGVTFAMSTGAVTLQVGSDPPSTQPAAVRTRPVQGQPMQAQPIQNGGGSGGANCRH
jgi:RNA polymerase sigma factor (sigma-70 family)